MMPDTSIRDTARVTRTRERVRRPLTRAAVIDAAARVIARCGHRGAKWSLIARELGDPEALVAASWFPGPEALIEECYARTAEGLHDCLLQAETAPGTGLDRIAAFLVAALETRRERGVFLSFRRTGDLSEPLQRRVREHDMMVRARLRRLLAKGRDDGTLAARSLEGVCDLILSVLQSGSPTAGDRPQQSMWDSELVELLLTALADPHPPEKHDTAVGRTHDVDVAHGSCLCGTVRFEIRGPFEEMNHCHCSMCRRHHGSVFASFVAVPKERFRWIDGEEWVTTYQSSQGQRSFCRWCGSATAVHDEDLVFCPASGLDTGSGARRGSQVFVGSRQSWHTVTDDLPPPDA